MAGRVSIAALCRIAVVQDTTYLKWRKKGLIKSVGSELSINDASELAVVGELHRRLSRPSDFDMVCRRLEGKLKAADLEGRSVIVVCHLADRAAELCFGPAEVGDKASHGREVHAIPVSDEILRVLAAFRTDLADQSARLASRA